MDAVTTPMSPAPIATPVRTRSVLSLLSAKWSLPLPHERDPVDLHAVDPHLEVQVTAGRSSRRADVCDRLACADALADADHDAAVADVGVPRFDAAPIVDQDEVAVRALGAR